LLRDRRWGIGGSCQATGLLYRHNEKMREPPPAKFSTLPAWKPAGERFRIPSSNIFFDSSQNDGSRAETKPLGIITKDLKSCVTHFSRYAEDINYHIVFAQKNIYLQRCLGSKKTY
jgi:hypothetical protein